MPWLKGRPRSISGDLKREDESRGWEVRRRVWCVCKEWCKTAEDDWGKGTCMELVACASLVWLQRHKGQAQSRSVSPWGHSCQQTWCCLIWCRYAGCRDCWGHPKHWRATTRQDNIGKSWKLHFFLASSYFAYRIPVAAGLKYKKEVHFL